MEKIVLKCGGNCCLYVMPQTIEGTVDIAGFEKIDGEEFCYKFFKQIS